MAGEGEDVDEVGVDVDGDGAEGLGASVDEEFDAVFFGDAADGRDGLDGADDVGAVGHGDQTSVGGDGFFNVGGIDHAGGGGEVDAREVDESGVGHGACSGRRDGVVLEGGGDDVGRLCRGNPFIAMLSASVPFIVKIIR